MGTTYMDKIYIIMVALIMSFVFSIGVFEKTILAEELKKDESLYSLTDKEKLEDLDEFCDILEKNQPHLYEAVSKEEFYRVKEEIKNDISDLSDSGFYYELRRMAALSHDSHTYVNNTPDANVEKYFIPIQINQIDNKWYLTASFGQEYKKYLSTELIKINGHLMKDILKLAKPYISFESYTRFENRFTEKINHADFLYHLGIIDNFDNISLTVVNNKGKEINFDIKPCSWDELGSKKYYSAYKETITNPNSNRIYDFLPLNKDVLFIRYNSSAEDSNYPLNVFTQDLKKEMESKKYSKVIVDLRNNTGGNYTLFPPTIKMIKEMKDKQNFKLYTLISDSTFSSGVVHAAQLQHDAGAILVGTPTSGNVYGYGDTDAATLSNSHLDIIYSTEYKELVDGYRADILYPDIYIKRTIDDYVKGIDRDVETILNGADIYF